MTDSENNAPLPDFDPNAASEKFKAIFTSGMHNKIAFFVTVGAIISMFFPIANAGFATVGLLGGGMGVICFLGYCALACFLYGGVDKVYSRIVAVVIVAMMLLNLIGIYSDLDSINEISRTFTGKSSSAVGMKLGFFLNAGFAIAVAIMVVKKPLTKNPRTF